MCRRRALSVRRVLDALSLALCCASLLGAGCFAHAEDRCRCAVVRHDVAVPPSVPDGQRALVVLLHGAFGFGAEWLPVTDALRARPDLSWFAFAWPGPFGHAVPARADAFRATLQRAVDTLPPSAREILVLAHSAGGAVAEYAARRLKLPPGVRVHVALLDAARMNVSPQIASREIDTPLGIALGTTQEPPPPLPRGVDLGDYRANDAPRRRRPGPPHGSTEADAPVTYLGRRVSHGAAVALVALPLIARLARTDPAPDAQRR